MGAHEEREPALSRLLENGNIGPSARQENVDSFRRARAFLGQAISPPSHRPVDPRPSAAEASGGRSRQCAADVSLSPARAYLDQMLTAANDARGFVDGMSLGY